MLITDIKRSQPGCTHCSNVLYEESNYKAGKLKTEANATLSFWRKRKNRHRIVSLICFTFISYFNPFAHICSLLLSVHNSAFIFTVYRSTDNNNGITYTSIRQLDAYELSKNRCESKVCGAHGIFHLASIKLKCYSSLCINNVTKN